MKRIAALILFSGWPTRRLTVLGTLALALGSPVASYIDSMPVPLKWFA